jgi:hypothetical protein
MSCFLFHSLLVEVILMCMQSWPQVVIRCILWLIRRWWSFCNQKSGPCRRFTSISNFFLMNAKQNKINIVHILYPYMHTHQLHKTRLHSSILIALYQTSPLLSLLGQCLRLDLLLYPLNLMENFDQTNYDDSQTIRVKTPAALFSKSSGKSPINRLRSQPSPSPKSFLEQHCENHQGKQATYYTQIDGERLNFCEKCAITLASHGHSITKMPQGTNGVNLFTSPSQNSAANSRFRSTNQSISRNPR